MSEEWLYLAEILNPVLDKRVISMAELFGKIKTFVSSGSAGVLLGNILTVLSSCLTQKKVKVMWKNTGVKQEDFHHSLLTI